HAANVDIPHVLIVKALNFGESCGLAGETAAVILCVDRPRPSYAAGALLVPNAGFHRADGKQKLARNIERFLRFCNVALANLIGRQPAQRRLRR
ncbi:MAG: hypothetical protein V3T62_02830, partial [Alphaproteobacteria bacterium]